MGRPWVRWAVWSALAVGAGAVALGLYSFSQGATEASSAGGFRRFDLQRHDLSARGWEAIQTRVELDPGRSSPKHTHPGDEIIYVLEGTLEYRIEGQHPVVRKAGEVLFVPAGKPHLARNVGRSKAAELATYVVQKGKPLVTIVDQGS